MSIMRIDQMEQFGNYLFLIHTMNIYVSFHLISSTFACYIIKCWLIDICKTFSRVTNFQINSFDWNHIEEMFKSSTIVRMWLNISGQTVQKWSLPIWSSLIFVEQKFDFFFLYLFPSTQPTILQVYSQIPNAPSFLDKLSAFAIFFFFIVVDVAVVFISLFYSTIPLFTLLSCSLHSRSVAKVSSHLNFQV